MIIKKYYPLLLALFLVACGHARSLHGIKNSTSKLQVYTNFERGAMGEIKYASNDSIILDSKHWKKWDEIGDQYCWFDFALTPVKNKNITVVLEKLSGIYRGGVHEVYTNYTYPVFSYDHTNWQRIPNVHYDKESKTFSFTYHFEHDTVWLAYAHPYSLKRLLSMSQKFGNNEEIKIKSLGTSKEGRELELFSISNYTLPDAGKRVAIITALQHPGEDAGGYVAEGVIRFLMTDSKVVQDIKNKWIIHVIPVMNPDGLYHGITRYNAEREDLNHIWLNPLDSLLYGPEVKIVRQWLDNQFRSSNPPNIFFDIHSHSQQITENDIFSINNKFEEIAKSATGFGFPLQFRQQDAFEGSAPAYLDQKYSKDNIPATTIELTQSYVGKKNYLNISDYLQYGEYLIKALNASFDY